MSWGFSLVRSGRYSRRVRKDRGLGIERLEARQVLAGNSPEIVPIGHQTALEGGRFTVDVDATDLDLPNDLLTFALVSQHGDPLIDGMEIDAATGLIVWTPQESQAPNGYTVHVSVTDSEGHIDVDSFSISVIEQYSEPEILPIGPFHADVGRELRFRVIATDSDIPPQERTFFLVGEIPEGATIDRITGEFSWTPPESFGGTTVNIEVGVREQFFLMGSDQETIVIFVVPRPMTQEFQVVDGDLIINGTSGDDQVAILGTGVAGQFQVFGTLGNGMVSGVTGDIRVQLDDGADQLSMNGVYVAGDINIDMGSGDDLVSLGQGLVVSTARNLNVELGEGNDGLIGSQLFVGQSQTFRGNVGNDNIALMGRVGPPFWLGTSSGAETLVSGGDGDDRIEVSYSFILGGWSINGDEGNDVVSLRTSSALIAGGILGGGGNDHLVTDTCYLPGALSLTGNAGSDWIEYRNSIGLIQTGIVGIEGHDLIEVSNVAVNTLRIEGGAGNDTVTVRASLLAQLFADLGDHDDALTVESSLVHGVAELNGGPGMGDWLIDRGNLFRGAIRKRAFEMFAS